MSRCTDRRDYLFHLCIYLHYISLKAVKKKTHSQVWQRKTATTPTASITITNQQCQPFILNEIKCVCKKLSLLLLLVNALIQQEGK